MGLVVNDNSQDEHGTLGSSLVRGDIVELPMKPKGRALVISIQGNLGLLDLSDFSTLSIDPNTLYPEFDGELTIENAGTSSGG